MKKTAKPKPETGTIIEHRGIPYTEAQRKIKVGDEAYDYGVKTRIINVGEPYIDERPEYRNHRNKLVFDVKAEVI